MCLHLLPLQEGERPGPVCPREPGGDDEEEGAAEAALPLPQAQRRRGKRPGPGRQAATATDDCTPGWLERMIRLAIENSGGPISHEVKM